jgi:NAD(P)-dependent dehydrogenase (short-subunit alcohol dehydrogenase family)
VPAHSPSGASVANPQDLDRLFTAAPDRFGHIDVVVANAGIELVVAGFVSGQPLLISGGAPA